MSPTSSNAFREGPFLFTPSKRGYRVRHGSTRRDLGEIIRVTEQSGRVAFALGYDRRRPPRSYRGKVTAAEALMEIDKLRRQAPKIGIEATIIRAWENMPASVRKSE